MTDRETGQETDRVTGQDRDGPAATAPSTRAERHEQTLAKILATAMETVVTRGFSALSMNKLAAEVGFTPGALYRYFTGKDALLAALVADVVGDVGRRIQAATSGCDADDDPVAALTRAAWSYRDYAREHPHRFGLIAAVLATPALVIEDEAQAMGSIAVTLTALAPIGRCFQRAAELGQLSAGDPRERTLLFFAGLHGVLSLRKQAERAPEQLDLDDLYRAMLATLFAGFGHAASHAQPSPATPRPPARPPARRSPR